MMTGSHRGMLICSIGLLSALSNLLLFLGVIMCFVSEHLKEAEWCGGGMLLSVAISYLSLSCMGASSSAV